MRKINTRDFSVATRTTSREINRRIVLNLIRERQPISRADLARCMNVSRGMAGVLVQDLIAQGVICEGATGEPSRGRKPTFLHIRTRDRLVIGVDVRFSKTSVVKLSAVFPTHQDESKKLLNFTKSPPPDSLAGVHTMQLNQAITEFFKWLLFHP